MENKSPIKVEGNKKSNLSCNFLNSLQASIKTNTCLVFINMLNNNPNVVAV